MRHAIVAQTAVGQTVMNIDGQTFPFLNIAHSNVGGSAQVGWSGALTANGYPTSALTTQITLNDLAMIPGYFGRYKMWWTGTGAFNISMNYIVYSGGTSTNLNANGANLFVFRIGYNGASTQPTAAAPVEFAIGALVSGIADNGSGFVQLTASIAGAFANSPVGTLYKINNVTNLPSAVYTVTAKSSNTIDLNVAYSATMAIVSGVPGVQSEAIQNGALQSWAFPAQGTSGANYSSMDGMVLCRSQNVGWNGQDDCSAVNSHVVNPDLVAVIKAPTGLNPRFIRFMPLTGVINGMATAYESRTTTASRSWGLLGWYKGNWGGLITNGGSDNFTTASNPTASPASGPPVDGETLTGYIDAAATNTGYLPTLAVNRSGFGAGKPITGLSATSLSLFMVGSVPPTGTTITMIFTGGGLASPFTYTYLTSTSVLGPGNLLDTSLSNISVNILRDINSNIRGNSAPLVAKAIVAQSGDIAGAQISFGYNPNITSGGVAQLQGSPLSMTGSDSASAVAYNFGYTNIGFLANNAGYTFTFSAVANAWIAVSKGTTGLVGLNEGPPLAWYEELCTQANVGLYLNLPVLYSDDAITKTVTHIANAGVKELVLSISNETWNTGAGGQWHVLNGLGQYLGIKSEFVGGGAVDAYTGLRNIQIANAARAAWAAAGRSAAQLFISIEYQFVNASGAVTNRFNGTALNISTNVTLAAYGGGPSNGTTTPTGISTNYSAYPNRPADTVDFVGPAAYFQGVQFNSSFGAGINTGVPLASYNCSLIASYNYVNGNGTEQQAALDFMFNGTSGDFYTLTGLNGGTANTSFALKTYALGSGTAAAAYWGIPTIAASYDSGRASIGRAPLGIVGYEGDAQADPINAGTAATIATNLTNLGDTSGYTSGLGTFCGIAPHPGGPTSTAATDGTNMQALLLGFKNDNRYKLLYLQYFSDFKTAGLSQGNRIVLPTTFGFDAGTGGGSWSKYPGSFYTTPYKSWNAIQQQNN